MRERCRKRFVIIFCALLLLQETHGFLKIQQGEENRERRNVNSGDERVETKSISTVNLRKKRGVFAVVLLGLSGVSAGVDIYKQEVGCKVETPSLQGKVNELDRRQTELIRLRDAINLAWVPVVAKERFITRLDADMVIIRGQLAEKDALQVDIVQLIDSNILTKLDGVKRTLENDIANYNDTKFPDPQTFNRKFFTEAQYALSLSLKLGSIGLYLGGKFLLPKVTARVTTAYARNVASQNPGLITRWINAGSNKIAALKGWTVSQLQSIQRSISLGWQTFQRAFPTAARALSGIGRVTSAPFRAVHNFYKNHQVGVTNSAKAGLVLFLIVYEIWGLVKFNQQCQNNLKEVNRMLGVMEENKRNMTRTKNNAAALLSDYTTVSGKLHMLLKYYNQMKGNLTSEAFLNFTGEVVELGENAKDQTDSIVKATNDVKTYISQIKAANDEKTDQLNKMLISALARINFRLDCVRSKLSIIATLALNCARGSNNFDMLYTDAKNAEKKKVTDACIANNFMTKPEIKNITEESMLLQNKQVICIRNNQGKKDYVCSQWYLDVISSIIESQVSGVTLADVEYFISVCPPGNVRDIQKTAICSEKERFVTPANVTKKFWKFDATQVKKAYNSCSLTQLQKEDICRLKQNLFTVEKVQGKYMYYPAQNVSAVFNSCVSYANIEDSPLDKVMMCNLQKTPGFEYGKPGGAVFWDGYIKKYGTAQIEAHIKTCAPAGDSGMENYHKYRRLNDILDQEMTREKKLKIMENLDGFLDQ